MLTLILFPALIVTGIAVAMIYRKRKKDPVFLMDYSTLFESLEIELGLMREEQKKKEAVRFSGVYKGFILKVEYIPAASGFHTEIIPPELTPPLQFSISVAGMNPFPYLTTGDKEFDSLYTITGFSEQEILHYFNQELRGHLKQYSRFIKNPSITGIRSFFFTPLSGMASPTTFIRSIKTVIALHKRTMEKLDPREELLERCTKDPDEELRIKALKQLALRKDPDLKRILKESLTGKRIIRNYALEILGDEGVAYLYQSLEAQTFPSVFLVNFIEMLFKKEGDRCLKRMLGLYHRFTSLDLKKKILKEAEVWWNEEVQELYLENLDNPDPALLLFVIRTLGIRGDLRAIPPLTALIHHTGPKSGTGQELKKAIDIIKSRHAREETGSLSLHHRSDAEGGLYLNEELKGNLTLAGKKGEIRLTNDD